MYCVQSCTAVATAARRGSPTKVGKSVLTGLLLKNAGPFVSLDGHRNSDAVGIGSSAAAAAALLFAAAAAAAGGCREVASPELEPACDERLLLLLA